MSIVLQELVKRYGAQLVVDHLSLEIREGELFVLLGASGSGKSTILRMIAGLVQVDDGRILLDGRDVTDLPPQARNVGLVFQNYSLFPHMSVAENVEFGLAVRKVPEAARAARRDELLALVGLAGFGGRSVRQLSGGQQQRVAVARALAFSPSVLLMDEPFGALDVKIRGQLRRALKEIQRKLGITTILVTHDQEEAFELADRIGIIEAGELLEVGPPAELYRRPRHEFVAGFLGEANLLGVRRSGDHIQVGALRLPLPISMADADPGVPWAVLFRPEDLALAPEDAEPPEPLLGKGLVEEVLSLGALQRVRVRLEPFPGAWPLGGDYGETGVLLRVLLPSRSDGSRGLEVGQAVRVGVKSFHLLPRIAMRLLLLIDDAAQMDGVARLGLTLASAIHGRVTALCVADDESAGQRLLARARESLSGRACTPVFEVRLGDPVENVLREIARESYDLLVVPGSSGDDGGEPRGEVAAEIARRAPIPVLAVNGARAELQRVLLCTAAGEPGKLDVVFGGQLARATGAAATLLHVDDPALGGTHGRGSASRAPDWKPRSWIERHLRQGVQTLLGQGVRVEAKVRRGPVVDEILAEASEGEHDLIVVGGHMAGTWLDVPDRDLATELVDRAGRPVLVVKGGFAR